MERRKSVRRRVRYRAVLRDARGRAGIGAVRDLSLDGAFVHVNPSLFGVGERTVCIVREVGARDALRARIARRSAEGIALRFDPYDNEAYTHLVTSLYA